MTQSKKVCFLIGIKTGFESKKERNVVFILQMHSYNDNKICNIHNII